VRTIGNDATLGLELEVLFSFEVSETPVGRNDNLLSAGEFVLGTTKSLKHVLLHAVLGANREKDLVDIHTSHTTSGLTERTTHTSLESVCSGTRKHFVDTEDVVGVNTHSHVERILTTQLCDVFVARNTRGFKRFARDLFTFQGQKVSTEGELINVGLFLAQIVNPQFGFRHTTTITRLDVRLVLAVTIASCWTSPHFGQTCSPTQLERKKKKGEGMKWIEKKKIEKCFFVDKIYVVKTVSVKTANKNFSRTSRR